jgi:transposase
MQRLLEQLKDLGQQAAEIEAQIVAWHRSSEFSRKLAKVPGVGPITASALAATVGNAHNFANGRQLAAWLGLVPRQSSSGGKNVLLGISKRGDTYLRALLIHGARSVIYAAQRKKGKIDSWLGALLERRNINVATVALANKNARIMWALLSHDREFQPDYMTARAAA